LLSAVEALKATAGGPTWNVRVVLDGEEEAGSANFRRFAEARPQALKTDLAITLDGPRHPSGRPTVYFGVRGGAGVTITVYGAAGDLHSGNYGNWAPDPSVALAKLLASMKDDHGRVTIQDFYRDVGPLTAAERQALNEAPDVEAVLARDFGVARPERPDTRLEVKLNEPTLSILVMERLQVAEIGGRP
jgi:acetylornithine deacetylase/succinyl-diaminopimelate desuccinylase-like protein